MQLQVSETRLYTVPSGHMLTRCVCVNCCCCWPFYRTESPVRYNYMFIFLKEMFLKEEQKELEAVQREEEERGKHRRQPSKLERDAKLRVRAARQKKNLQAYTLHPLRDRQR